MKHLLLMIAAILCCFTLLLLLCGAGSPAPSCVGTWRIDTALTPGVEQLYLMFGSALRTCGAEMHIRPDGTMDYYIGLTGGKGTYTVEGDTLVAELVSYIESAPLPLRLAIDNSSTDVRLIYRFRDEVFDVEIYWVKYK